MGFDPRRWQPQSGSRASAAVTSNVETLLVENDALRREVRRLQLQLQAQVQGASRAGTHGLTAAQVAGWGAAMARHPRWLELRMGPPGGLRGLVEQRQRLSWNPALSLEQELDRRCPGLGTELTEALRGPHSRVRWAVRAAFALYGQRASEWLSDAPLRVVEELLRQAPSTHRRGTRTENHSQGEAGSNASGPNARGRDGARHPRSSPFPSTDPRQAALLLLGLEAGASIAAIKRAYRRLAKAHHPDGGGDVAAFHRLDAAYRLLIG